MTHTQTQGADGAGTMTAGEPLDLRDLHAANIARQAEWCPDQVPDLSFRGNELGGECGEAQNVIKKLERERQGWRGSRATKDDLADELADVVICADLCAVTAGIDLGAAVRRKFNATSEKQGLSVFLPMPSTPAPAATSGVPDSVRALSEAATQGVLNVSNIADGWRHTICAGPTWRVIAQFERAEDAEFFAAAGTHVRALIAAQPAGQAGDAGAGDAEQRKELERQIEFSEGCIAGKPGYHMAATKEQARKHLTYLQGELAKLTPAPNSTRTGAAETEETVAKALYRHDYGSYPDQPEWDAAPASVQKRYRALSEAALAARPEAPSDAGWRERAADEIDVVAERFRGDARSYIKAVAAIFRAEADRQEPPPSDPAPSGQAEG